MSSLRREIPPEGFTRMEIELWRGDITVRTAGPGEAGSLESDWDLQTVTDGTCLRVWQPTDGKRPLGLADLIGEQQIRIEVEGVVLLDKQIRHGAGNLEIVLPASVHEISCRTARGDIRLEQVAAAVNASTGRGNVQLSGGPGEAMLETTAGDIVAIDLKGARMEGSTGHGDIVLAGGLAGAKMKTGHGRITGRLTKLEGEYELQTGRGDIVLDLQDSSAIRIDASTRHGIIQSNLPLVKVGSSGPEGNFSRRLVGMAPGDGPAARMSLNTRSGDIRVFRRKSVTATTGSTAERSEDPHLPAPPGLDAEGKAATVTRPETFPSSMKERTTQEGEVDQAVDTDLKVLEALGRGELSTEEALVLLERSAER